MKAGQLKNAANRSNNWLEVRLDFVPKVLSYNYFTYTTAQTWRLIHAGMRNRSKRDFSITIDDQLVGSICLYLVISCEISADYQHFAAFRRCSGLAVVCSTPDQALQVEALAWLGMLELGEVGGGGGRELLVALCYVETVPACLPPGSYADLTFNLNLPLMKTMLEFHNKPNVSFVREYFYLHGLTSIS